MDRKEVCCQLCEARIPKAGGIHTYYTREFGRASHVEREAPCREDAGARAAFGVETGRLRIRGSPVELGQLDEAEREEAEAEVFRKSRAAIYARHVRYAFGPTICEASSRRRDEEAEAIGKALARVAEGTSIEVAEALAHAFARAVALCVEEARRTR